MQLPERPPADRDQAARCNVCFRNTHQGSPPAPLFTITKWHNKAVEPGFQCAGCGKWNSISVDLSAGRRQRYIEDCQVCCKPNHLQIEYNNKSLEVSIQAELE